MTTLIELPAWGEAECSLSHEQAAQLESLDFVNVFTRPTRDTWLVKADSRIGVAHGNGWELRVNPHFPIPKLFFLLAYASDPHGWKDETATFAGSTLMDAVASGFAFQAARALEQGVLRGYVGREERLATIRGRVDFAAQLAKGGLLPIPVHLRFDEFTEDILENKLLKTAGATLLRLPRVPHRTRRQLLQLDAFLDAVTPVNRPHETRMPTINRLNRRYEAALRLATLILHGTSIDAPRGKYEAIAYTFDMNRIFEDFVTTALSEALRRYGGEVKSQYRDSLGENRKLPIRPDVTWWRHSHCVAIADAKYKRIATNQYPNADAYQMLAYCTALKRRRGFLVYAKQSGEENTDTKIKNVDVTIAVRTLDVEDEPADLLRAVEELAHEISRSDGALVPVSTTPPSRLFPSVV